MKIHIIYLAAGFSKRYGGNKLLAEVEGRPMYRHLLERLLKMSREKAEIPFGRLVVVTQYDQILQQLRGLPLHTVRNPDSSRGIASSLREGILAAGMGQEDACLCCVADQPYLTAETVISLLKGWMESGKGLGCVCCQGRRGNPALFSGRYREELLALQGDTGGSQILKRHPEDIFYLEVEDAKELMDIDIKM